MKTACVFGACGGIGSALIATLEADPRIECVYAASRTPPENRGKLVGLTCDVSKEADIAVAAKAMAHQGKPDLVIVATGALHFAGGEGPERSVKALDADRMAQMFALNTIAPAMVARHVLPLFARGQRSVCAFLSARVGSICDNRLGGWHSYRASKAALNMLVCNFAIEMKRTHPQHVCVSLHPGTVDTRLSKPFQANLPEGQVRSANAAARDLLGVLERLGPDDSGGFFAWDGEPIGF